MRIRRCASHCLNEAAKRTRATRFRPRSCRSSWSRCARSVRSSTTHCSRRSRSQGFGSVTKRTALGGLRRTSRSAARPAQAGQRQGWPGHAEEEGAPTTIRFDRSSQRSQASCGSSTVVSRNVGPTVRPHPKLKVNQPLVARIRPVIGSKLEHFLGAGYRIRTGDLQLGKLTLYR